MKDKEQGDVIGISYCSNCKEETERQYFGFVPHYMMDMGPQISWYESQICINCGSLTPLNIIEDDVNAIEEEYVDFLIEHDIIDEEEREKWLQTDKENKNGT